jgi:hypothetical protein
MKNPKFASRHHFLAILALGVFLGTNHASAAFLDPITGVTASSLDTAAGDPNFTATNASIQIGATSHVLGASDSLADTGIAADGSTRFGDWLTSSTPGQSITYNLGGTYNVSDLLIWNYNQDGFTSAGANSVTVLSSTTGLAGSFSTVGTVQFDQVTITAPTGTAAQDTGDTNDGYDTPAQTLPFDISNAHYVELVINSNWGFGGGVTGFNEVNFVGTAVPEPSTFAMLGLGLLGLVAWQRKRAAFKL